MDLTLDELRAAFVADASNPLTYRALASALSTGTEPRELAELHERWAEVCTDPRDTARALAEAGEQRVAFGDVDHAVRLFVRALELDPRQAIAGAAFSQLAGERRDTHRHVEQLARWAEQLEAAGASAAERAEVQLALAHAHAAIPGRLERSFEHHRAAVALDPELESTLDEAVERAQKARRISDVRTLLALAAEHTRSPERRAALLRRLAEAQQAMPADLDGAIQTLAQASALAPDDTALLEERIQLLLQRVRRKKGTPAERDDLDAIAGLEVERARRLDTEAALDAVERALQLCPEHAQALSVLQALVDGSPTDAHRQRLGKHLQARVTRAGLDASPEARLALCAWLEREERPGEAYDVLAPLLLDAPSREWLARALTYASSAQRWPEAVAATQRLHAGKTEAAHERVALEDLLERCLAAADLDTAERVAARLLELAPQHGAALFGLTRIHAQRGAHDALRGVLERRLAHASDPQQQRDLLRQLVAVADGPLANPELATDAFQRLAELDPRDAALRSELLTRLASVGRYRAMADVRRWEIGALESLAERKAALTALLAEHEEHAFDNALLVDALRAYRAVDPGDGDARSALVRILHGAGELAEAAQLLQEAVGAATDDDARLRALAELADIYDFGLRDDDAARKTALQTLELDSDDAQALDRLERIATRSERYDWMVEALEHRAISLPDVERADIYLKLARLHDEATDGGEAAMEAYEWVRVIRRDTEAAAALLRLYAQHERSTELAALLDDLASETTDLETRVAYLTQRARLLRDVLGDPDEAAECYREVRTLRPDAEALTALLHHARENELHAELAELLAVRLAESLPPEEATPLGMERATLLLDHLDDTREAERELLAIRERSPAFAPALARLGTLYLEEGDDAQLAEVTEAHLALTTHLGQRAVLAKRLLGLYERSLPDMERALAAARHWVDAAPTDLDALRALSDRLDGPDHAAERVKTLDARADEVLRALTQGAGDDTAALRDEALLAIEESMVTAVESLGREVHAETRFMLALELAHDDDADVDRFVHLAASLDAALDGDRLRRAAATYLARKATTVERPLKERLFLVAADLFGSSLEDTRLAFEVARRAITECSDDPAVLRALVDFGTSGGFTDELEQVLEERFAASLDAKAARALQRERADLLYSLERYEDAADAYHRLASMEPDNQRAKDRHRECLVRAERYSDLLVTLGQALRRLRPEEQEARVELLKEVARTWETGLADRAEALDAWKAVSAAAPEDSEASAALERLAAPR
ncbi:MAG: hypothetical protein R3B40_31415 [Polyangiales bacterium]